MAEVIVQRLSHLHHVVTGMSLDWANGTKARESDLSSNLTWGSVVEGEGQALNRLH